MYKRQVNLFFKKTRGVTPNDVGSQIDGAIFTSTVAEGDPNGYWLRLFQKAVPGSSTNGYLNRINKAINSFTGGVPFTAGSPVAVINGRPMVQKTSIGYYRSGDKIVPTEKISTIELIDGFSRNPQEMQLWYQTRYFGVDINVTVQGRTIDCECDLIRRKMFEKLVGQPTYTQFAYRSLLSRDWLDWLQKTLVRGDTNDLTQKGKLMFDKSGFAEYGTRNTTTDLFQGFTAFNSAPSTNTRGRTSGNNETVY